MSFFTGDDSIPVTVSSGRFSDDRDHYDSDSVTDSPRFNESGYATGGDEFVARRASEALYSPPIYGSDGEYGVADGPILPDVEEMRREEGFAIREWRRENAILLEEKEKRERELLIQIMDEADEYKVEFYRKKTIACETNRATNREKEKLFLASLEKFYAEADKDYWKSIAELIPNEVATIEKRRGKKDQEKKPSVVVVQGPKPGKPTDLSRMRQILLKLKHNTPDHLKHSPPTPVSDAPQSSKAGAIVAKPKEVVAAA